MVSLRAHMRASPLAPPLFLFVAQEGGLTPLVHLAKARNGVLKIKAAAALTELSQCVPARPALVKARAVSALIGLSKTRSHTAKRLCAVALCNLVNDVPERKRKRVEIGALTALISLAQTSKLDEQERIAHALSELSNRRSLAKAMVKVSRSAAFVVLCFCFAFGVVVASSWFPCFAPFWSGHGRESVQCSHLQRNNAWPLLLGGQVGGLEVLRVMVKLAQSSRLVQFCVATLLNLSKYRRSRRAMVFGEIIAPEATKEAGTPSASSTAPAATVPTADEAKAQSDGHDASATLVNDATAVVAASASEDATGSGATATTVRRQTPAVHAPSVLSVLMPLLDGKMSSSMPFLLSSVLCNLSFFEEGRVRLVQDGAVEMIAVLQHAQVCGLVQRNLTCALPPHSAALCCWCQLCMTHLFCLCSHPLETRASNWQCVHATWPVIPRRVRC